MRLVYNVYDDDNQIESKQFDNFPEALEYAKQGLITYICEEDLDCPECEERVVWTWDSTWDDEEAIAAVTSGRENVDLYIDPEREPILAEDIEINISGPAEEVRDLASFVFGYEFDLDWDAPREEDKVDEQDFVDDFGYEDEPAVRDLDFDVDEPFEDDLYYSEYSEEEFEDEDKLDDEEDFEVGEPEIVENPDVESEEDQPEELEVSKDFEEESIDSEEEENKEDPKEELKESLKEEVKLATNKKGDYLVAADSGKGYTVFNRNNVCIGGFDGEDDQKAIDKFNKGEFKDSLKESLNLPAMRASEIKGELDLHGDIYFDFLEPIDESDEDGWRGANEIRIVDTGSGYEGYVEWLDQDGDYIESDPEFTCDTFEELLREIDGFYVTVMDLDEYINGTLDECANNKKKLKEGYNVIDLTIEEIKKSLDSGELVLDAMMDDEDIDYVIIKPTSTGDYEVYFQYSDGTRELDQDTELETFGDVLYFVDESYGTVVDLEAYDDEKLAEAVKMTKDELLDKEGTTDVDLINAGRPEEERVELEEGRQPVYSNVIFYCYDQNNDEYTYTKANMTPIMIRTEVDRLVKDGATRVYVEAKIDGEWEALDKYTYDPEWTPGTLEYAERNRRELAWESLDQEDDLTDQEFAEQLKEKLEEIKK